MRIVVAFVLLLVLPTRLHALRATCAFDLSDHDGLVLELDTAAVPSSSIGWESALGRLSDAGIVKKRRQWFLPTAVIKNFDVENFSLIWEHAQEFAPGQAYLQLLVGISEILDKEVNPRVASVFLASVLTRALELGMESSKYPDPDSLFTTGLGSLWNYMVLFQKLYEAEDLTAGHEKAFHKLQLKWLHSLREQLQYRDSTPYPVALIGNIFPEAYSRTYHRHCRSDMLPLSQPGAFEVLTTLERGSFYRWTAGTRLELGRSVVSRLFPVGPPLKQGESALLMRADHLHWSVYLEPEELAYELEIGGRKVGVGLRLQEQTRGKILQLINAYIRATRELPQELPAPL